MFSSAAIDNPYDFNRDGRVTAQDYAIVRSAAAGRRSLALLNAPAAAPSPPIVPLPQPPSLDAAADEEEEPGLLA
jgi:hypothetical protein